MGDNKSRNEHNDNLVLFVTYPQEGTNPDTNRKWMSSINDCLFLIRIPNPLDRIWILDNYNSKKDYSRGWLEDDTQDERLNIKQKVYLVAYSSYKSSKNPNIPLLPIERYNMTFEASRKDLSVIEKFEAFNLKSQADEQKILLDNEKEMRQRAEIKHRDEIAAKNLEIQQLKVKSKDQEKRIKDQDKRLKDQDKRIKDREKRLKDIENLDKEIAKRAKIVQTKKD